MKKTLLTLAFLLSGAILWAQEWNADDLESLRFRNVGPAGMSGRVTTIDFDHHSGTLYVGSASGGLWRSRNEGQTWEPIFEHEKTSSIGAVAVDPTNPDVIWVGTGEGNPRNSQSSGYGIYKSLDGGETWIHLGLENTRNIHRVIVDPTNPNTVYVGAIGVAWGDTEDRGVYKTTDGGKTWKKILYNNHRTGVGDMVMDPMNPNKLIVAMWEYRRWPWEFKSGGEGSGIYVTFDGGENWIQRTNEDGLPEGHLGRCGLAISASDPDIVYALVESKGNNALYRSEDGGHHWRMISDDDNIGNRPFYYADIYVDPERPNRIYSLWSILTRSDDGGRTWSVVGPYSTIHPDHHAFWIDPRNPDHVIDGNDGGLNISYDGGETWRFVENLPLAQFYHIAVDNQQPYRIFGGMQDNGSWMGPAYTWRIGGIRNDLWEEIAFGDGFDVVPHPTDPNIAYAMWQEGHVNRIDLSTGYSKLIRPVHPEGEELRFNWNAAIAQDPFNSSAIYFGSQYVHRSPDMGDTWEIISPDLTTNDPDHQKASESGGLTFDVTGAENYTTILAIAPSAVDQNEIWVSTDDGKLQLTRNRGETWEDLSSKLPGMPEGAWIPQIHLDHNSPGTAWVVVNDYRRNNWEPYLYMTTNHGRTFKRVVRKDQVHGYVLCVWSHPESGLVLLGTENGLYFSIDDGNNWTHWGDDLPTVPVADIAYQEREGDIVLGTFGRSAWVLDDIRPLVAMAQYGDHLTDSALVAFEVPDAIHAVYRRSQGMRFAGYAVYSGENRRHGARVSFWVGRDTSDAMIKKHERIHWDIVDAEGDTIRHLETPYSKGMNRMTWDMMEKGVRMPSMEEPRRERHSDPGAVPVLPGSYTVHLRIGDYHARTEVAVLKDPRLNLSDSDLEDNYRYQRELMPYIEAVSEVTANLRKARRSIGLVERMLESVESEDDSAIAPVRERIKAVKDSLEQVRLAIFGKENIEGYYEQPDIWVSKLGTLGYYNSSNLGRVTGNTRVLADRFVSDTRKVVDLANEFFEEDWSGFRDFIETLDLSVFDEMESVQLE